MTRTTRGAVAAALVLLATAATALAPAGAGAATDGGRASTTEQAPPVGAVEPLAVGGTRNFLGTGTLLGGSAPFPTEHLTLAVNPWCTWKSNGDRYQSGWLAPSGSSSASTCDGTPNDEHRAGGYLYSIEVPHARTSAIEVLLYDARYSRDVVTGPTGTSEPAIDTWRLQGAEDFTFTLLAADDTPTDDTDNAILCSRTYGPTTPFELTFLGSARWNRLPCTIAPSDPAGTYLLQVTNGGGRATPIADGTNAFGIVASRASDGLDPALALCDSRADPGCPRVAGRGGHSIFASATTSVATFPLTDVEGDHEGRILEVELFDPGEGGTYIEVLRPTGPATWTPTTFSWSVDDHSSATSVTRLDVTQSRFDRRLVRIAIDLTGYDPPAANTEWRVRYSFVAAGTVTDRTTWDAALVDPSPGSIAGSLLPTSGVEGATVWLVGTGEVWPGAGAPVGADHRYHFPPLPDGAYQLFVAPPPGSGLTGRWVGGGTDRAAATVIEVTSDGLTRMAPTTTLVAGASLAGTATSGAWPLAGAAVHVFGVGETWIPRASTTTGPDGSWAVAGLPGGAYEVRVEPRPGDGRTTWSPGVARRADATPIVVELGQVVGDVHIDPTATRGVTGRVTDPAGAGVAGTRVLLYEPSGYVPSDEATSRADGSFAVIDVPDGIWEVRFLPPEGSGLRSTWYGVGLRASSAVTVTGGITIAGVDQRLRPA